MKVLPEGIDILSLSLCCFPGASDGKASACNAGEVSRLIPQMGKMAKSTNGLNIHFSCSL